MIDVNALVHQKHEELETLLEETAFADTTIDEPNSWSNFTNDPKWGDFVNKGDWHAKPK